MKIEAKVNLILISIFISGILFSRILLSNLLEHKTQTEINNKVMTLMELNNYVREYTNQSNADDFETEIVNRFRLSESNTKPVSGYRTLLGTKLYYTAKPFSINDKSCLGCHSTPEEAPKSQLATYGAKNGFGWKLNEILGIQITYIPAEQVI